MGETLLYRDMAEAGFLIEGETLDNPLPSFATEAERLASSGYTVDDLGKMWRQLDDSSIWTLTGYSPVVWTEVGSGGDPGDEWASDIELDSGLSGSANYTEITYEGNLPTVITAWDTSAKSVLQYETTLTYAGVNVTQSVTKQYTAGVLVKTVTETFTYVANKVTVVSKAVI